MSALLNMGPFTLPLLLIAISNVVLIGIRATQVARASAGNRTALESGINTILFWGVMALLIGYLGQYGGLYRSMTGLSTLDAVNPGLIARGIAESILPTIVGFAIVSFSAIAWFVLRGQVRRLAA